MILRYTLQIIKQIKQKRMPFQLTIFFLCLTSVFSWIKVQEYSAAESNENIKALAFSTDSSKLFTAGSSGTIQVWELASFALQNQINVGEVVSKLLVHPTSSHLYASTVGGSIKVYDANYSEIYSSTYQGFGYAYDMAWKDQDGSALYVVGSNKGIPMVYVHTPQLGYQDKFEIEDFTQTATIQQIASSPDYSKIFVSTSYSTNTTFLIGFTPDGQNQQSYETNENYDEGFIKLLEFDKNNANRLFVGEKGTNEIEVKDTQAVTVDLDSILLTGERKISNLCGDISDRILVGYSLAAAAHNVIVYDYQANEIEQQLGHDDNITSISGSPDQQFIAVGLNTGGLAIWSYSNDTIEQSTGYAATLAAVSGVIFVGSVVALAATSAAQGAAAGGVAGAGAMAAGPEAGLTGKNLL